MAEMPIMGSQERRTACRRTDSLTKLMLIASVVLAAAPSSHASRHFAMVSSSSRNDNHQQDHDRTPPRSYNKRMERRSSSRYFTHEGMLPPLDPVPGACNAFPAPSIPLIYTNDPQSVYDWCSKYLLRDGCTIGFDVETASSVPWRSPCHFHGPATVQLATCESAIVIHMVKSNSSPLTRSSEACVPLLRSIILDPNFVKVGCGLDEDLLELNDFWAKKCGQQQIMDARSRLDLGGAVLGTDDVQKHGLKSLSRAMLGIDLPKSRNIATSDWSRAPLGFQQITYAARDAWVGAALVERLASLDPRAWNNEQIVWRLHKTEHVFSLVSHRHDERKRAKQELLRLKRRSSPEDRALFHLLSDVVKSNTAFRPPKIDLRDLFSGSSFHLNATSIM